MSCGKNSCIDAMAGFDLAQGCLPTFLAQYNLHGGLPDISGGGFMPIEGLTQQQSDFIERFLKVPRIGRRKKMKEKRKEAAEQFRLFNAAEDGSGLVPHDGAEGAVNRLEGDKLEVSVGEDRYRFPAKANAQ